MNGHDGNVAFKCTYNDGGEKGFVGFAGTCTDGNILRNVKTHPRTWCSNPANRCRQFCDRGFRRGRPQHPCYESQIIDTWRFGPGTYHSGERDGKPIPMYHAQVGKVALLTTRHPERDTEQARIVFGVYKIERVGEDDNGDIWVEGSADHAIRLSESAAFALPYWRFKTSEDGQAPAWKTGLFRYLSDQEVSNFLHALRPLLKSSRDRTVLEELLECCGNLPAEIDDEDPDGDIAGEELKGKYGPGGEGERHRRLKEFVGQHPDVLNLGTGRAMIEHRFTTGDRVDVAVDLDSGGHCVVEIEVEGRDSTLVGAHQALKYRALRAGQLDTRKQPHAFLVAYSIPKSVRNFCKKHGVTALEIQPDE
ncbi:MAG: hypothetical protein OXF79_02420 [Chloroflexi bacterium]|nr:hypothetical protein [Chloroflexota bacterium]